MRIYRRLYSKRIYSFTIKTVRELCDSVRGGVIATGGGAILRQSNLIAMKSNGTVIFLDRPLSDLTPTDDRPLADQADKIRALYETRYPLYLAAADAVVPVSGTPEETAQQVWEKLQ